MDYLLQDHSQLLDLILSASDEAFILVDNDFMVQYMNESAMRILKMVGHPYKGRHFYDDLQLLELANERIKPILMELLEEGISDRDIIRRSRTGKVLSIKATTLYENRIKKGLLLTAQDITKFTEMEQELDMAFALTLPNSKVEYKLKSIAEYQDSYNPSTGKITITGIIADGGYRHVVNCLKLFSVLHQQGITKVIGIDKDLLVQAFIFHDLGKSQPVLEIGDVVVPEEAFEDGKQHASRSAEIARHYYHQTDDTVEIIKNHHHKETDLPASFPWRLLPMFRLFQLIDGLSAAITRGGVSVDFKVVDCVITVTEENHRPQYHGTWQLNLYTGDRKKLK